MVMQWRSGPQVRCDLAVAVGGRLLPLPQGLLSPPLSGPARVEGHGRPKQRRPEAALGTKVAQKDRRFASGMLTR